MSLIGHERQISYLNTVVAHGRMAHAYFFYGPEHVGKLAVARAFVKTFFCEYAKQKPALQSICDECRSCGLVEENTHPDVLLIDLDHTLVSKKESRKEIPIDDIRELRRRFSLAHPPGQYRIAILNQADKMSEEAANAFLKLLEEPGERTLFILMSSVPDAMKQTLISRAVPIRFSHVPEKILGEYLLKKNKNAEERQELLYYTAGRPGVLIRLLEDEEYYAMERKFAKAFGKVERASLPYALRFAERAAVEEALREKTVEYMLRALRRHMLTVGTRGAYSYYPQKIKQIDRIATLLATTNVNPRLALDAMFLEFGTYH